MKKILLLLPSLASLFSLHAQVLFGTTSNGGGINGKGSIHQFTIEGNAQAAPFTFAAPDGEHPQFSNLVMAANGKMYGMTRFGGLHSLGILFSYDPQNGGYTKIMDFDGSNGSNPSGSMVLAANGKLYGLTTKGGVANAGTVFSFDPVNSIFTKVKDLDFTNGAYPYGKLTPALDGKLYGLASYGGARNTGVIFCVDPASLLYQKVMDFDGGTGGTPYGSLLQSSDGNLYGMTTYGGTKGAGVIFSYHVGTFTYSVLSNLSQTKGANPYGDLVEANDGRLYGMTRAGGYFNDGVIFSYHKTTGIYRKLMEFDGGSNGGYPYGSFTIADNGRLYGTTSAGGASGAGIIFSLDINNSIFTKVKDMEPATGGNPQGTLTQAADGKMYSLTTNGGNGDNGVIFAFDPGTNTYHSVKDFGANETGNNAVAGVIKDASGKLYGMTEGGGSNGVGIIYAFNPATSTFTNLYSFDGANGASPRGSLVFASNGKLYGMTFAGGDGYGIIFSFDTATRTFDKLHSFTYSDGANPAGSLVQASDGKLYGLTYYGGAAGAGVLFSFDPGTLQFNKLKDFDVTNGGYPQGSLVQFIDGKLYGLTHQGGRNSLGVLFSFDPGTNTYAKLKDFGTSMGTHPTGSMVQAANGRLYGMTSLGGVSNQGVIFHYIPSTNTYKKLKDFDGTTGGNPYGSLLQAANGNLYGVTFAGGTNNGGVLFSLNPANSVFTKLADFAYGTGTGPRYVGLTEVSCIALTWYQDADGDGFGNAAISQVACVQPTGFVTNNKDCNDSNPGITTGITWYIDGDMDGYGGDSMVQCNRPTNGFLQSELAGTRLDCRDDDASIYPSATEIPDDGIDQDCDGMDLKTWYADADGDGFGNINSTITANEQPSGYVSNHTDCNDGDAGIQTARWYYLDSDGDGYGNNNDSMLVCASTPPPNYAMLSTDCNNNEPTIFPGASEIPDDGIDQDCDGIDLKTWYADADGDGFGDINATTTANGQPGGFVAGNTDCNDADNTIYPSAPELCDGKDNNCDGTVDEECPLTKIKIGDLAQAEGNMGSQLMIFTVSLTKVSYQTVSVQFETRNGVAKSPTDYVAQSGILIFEPGVKTQTISVEINGDLDTEGDETFKILLSNPVNATFQDSVGVGKILNDDGLTVSASKNAATTPVFNNTQLLVMPNPAATVANVGLKGYSGKVTIQLLTANGEQVKETKLFANGLATHWHSLVVTDMPAGTYLLLATDEKGNRKTSKLVVSR